MTRTTSPTMCHEGIATILGKVNSPRSDACVTSAGVDFLWNSVVAWHLAPGYPSRRTCGDLHAGPVVRGACVVIVSVIGNSRTRDWRRAER